MTLTEAHTLEIRLEYELSRLDPNNGALIIYSSTWKAIDAYEKAIKELKEAEKSG